MARPLTKRKKTGELYTRPKKIEAKIDAALAQDTASLRRQLQVTDQNSDDFLPSECLVHLIRDAIGRSDQERIEALAPVLLKRCEDTLCRKIQDCRRFDATALREEILGEFAALLASDRAADNPDELDYFECRFNRAFRALRIDMVRKEIVRRQSIRPLPDGPTDNESGTDDEVSPAIPEAFHVSPTQEQKAMVKEILEMLPPDVRRAVILCWLMEYEVESKDPSKVTAATICGVSGRTIRYRLKIAVEQFSERQTGGAI